MKKTVVVLIALVLCTPVITFAANGQPFLDLQSQIDQLKSQLQNIQLTPGPQGPQGPAGPAGVANGITAGVHGVVASDGTIQSGVGFTSSYVSGVYYITFSQAFSSDPHCVITPLQSPPTAICSILGYGPVILDVNCSSPTIQNGLFTFTQEQATFSFICIE